MAGRPFEKLFIRRGPVLDDDGELGKLKVLCSWNWLPCLEEAISMERALSNSETIRVGSF